MTDSLSDIFTKVVPIEDRNLLPENIEVEVIDKVLHFKFDLKFLDTSDALILDDVNNVPVSIPVNDIEPAKGYTEETITFMQDLEVKEGF